jgi:hypothetical protein
MNPERRKAEEAAAVEAMGELFDGLGAPARDRLFEDMVILEGCLRRGMKALALLDAVRQHILDAPDTLGGEGSPFVRKIDQLIPRD